jgi:HlyD family secretion protein
MPNEQLPGQVLRVGRESDRVTEELEVDVAFTTALKDFRLGEQADVHIITEGKKGVLSIPSAALVSKGKSRGVFLVEKGRLKFREVTAGIEDPRNFTEVLAGITGVERIAMAPPQEMMNFKEGMKVKIAK